MHVFLQPPRPPLDEFVETFWYVSGYVPYGRDKILPTEHIELIFNLGDPHKVYADVDDDRFILNENAWVCGLQRGYIVSEAMGRSDLVGVRFKPAGFYPFLGRPIADLDDLIVELEFIWGRWAECVREQLFYCHSVTDRFALLERALLDRWQPPDRTWRAMRYAARSLADLETPLAVADLAAELGYSQRHLIAQFKRMVGLSPKFYGRLNRFHQLLQLAGHAVVPNWGELAHHCGYYDQAHFNKDFRAFSGLNPGEYLALRQQFLPPDEVESAGAVKFVPLQ